MYVAAEQAGRHVDRPSISMRCPNCRHIATFEPVLDVGDIYLAKDGTVDRAALRRCPQVDCGQLVLVLASGIEIIRSYPPEVLDFDSTDLPDAVLAALQEAVTCHADGCYAAGGMMTRKCLEALCQDRNAKGGNLAERIKALRSAVILPPALFDALDEIRLLGNDAAHIEARVYDSVGKEEVELAIALAKEILKSVYQLSSLVAQLQAQKRP